jgi:hypothetical protein
LVATGWAQPDHFRWLSGYLGYRNLRGFTRRMMATVVIALGAAPILTMWTPAGPRSVAGWVISVLVAVCCGAMAMMWLIQWPSRRQSMTQPGEAHAIAERLRREVAAIPRDTTASVGVASITRKGAAEVDARTVIEH